MVDLSNVNTLSKFDVIGFAKEIMSEVENIRSFTNQVNDSTGDKFNLPIESRVNAFFRLIGLPMFVNIKKDTIRDSEGGNSSKHVTPGHDYDGEFLNAKVTNIEKIGDEKIAVLLQDREDMLKKIESSIGIDETINNNMKESLKNPIPLVANFPKIPTGKKSTVISEYKRDVFKMLFPLITSYSNVMPKRNEIGKPFVTSEQRTIGVNDSELKRPFIEFVVRTRFISLENANNENGKSNYEDHLKAIEKNMTKEDFERLKNNFSKLNSANLFEQFIIDKLMSVLSQLANKWREIKKKQEIIRIGDVYDISIKTISSQRSLFGNRIAVSTQLDLRETSNNGKELIRLKEEFSYEDIILSLLPTEDSFETASKNARGQVTKNAVYGGLNNSFFALLNNRRKQLQKDIDSIEGKIKKNTQEMEALRVEIDMMTGEFTGLSIPDIVAVITALFTINKANLLDLLDKKTKENMMKDPALKTAIEKFGFHEEGPVLPDANLAYNAVKELERNVTIIFQILNILVGGVEDRTKRNKKKSKNGEKSRNNNKENAY